MLIIMHTTPFTYEGDVEGTLTARHSIALTLPGGVVNLNHDEVSRVLPALEHFAEHGSSPAD